MTGERMQRLIEKLERGIRKTVEIFNTIKDEQWHQILYPAPVWEVRHLLAHFVYSEIQLLDLYKSIANGGPGAPEGIDIDQYNAVEQKKLEGVDQGVLLDMLIKARTETIAWVKTLNESQLDMVGRHPVLGEQTVETMIEAIYGHQLFHMRDLIRFLNEEA